MTVLADRETTHSVIAPFTQQKSGTGADLTANEVSTNLPSGGARQMGIDAEAHAHVMSLLTDLYSNPTLAVIREYSSNALDSHQEAGNPAPIEVTLPSSWSPTFVVKDQGVGMSRDDLYNIYAQYGKSTKRDDMRQVGAFGLGCKSALTYVQQFTVTAVKNGEKNVAIIGYGDDSVPTLNIVRTMKTDEPNGVTITIPSKDATQFRDEAARFFATWERGTVLVDGQEPETMWGGNGAVTTDDYSMSPRSRKRESGVKIIMGNVAYAVSADFAWEDRADVSPFVRSLLSRWAAPVSLLIRVPIGSVDLTPNREELRYSPRTMKFLRDTIVNIGNDAEQRVKDLISNADTPEDALRIASQWSSAISSLLAEVSWQGESVPTRIDLVNARVAFNRAVTSSGETRINRCPMHRHETFYALDTLRYINTADGKSKKRYYVVVDADSNDRKAHEPVAKDLRHYLLNKGIDLLNVEVYIFLAEPNKWVTAAWQGSRLYVAEIAKGAREYRRRMAAERRAERAQNGVSSATKSTRPGNAYPTIRVDVTGDKVSVERHADLTGKEIAALDGPVYYMTYDRHRDNSASLNLTPVRTMAEVIGMKESKFVVVMVANSRKTSTLLRQADRLVNIHEAAESIAKEAIADMTPGQATAYGLLTYAVGYRYNNARMTLFALLELEDLVTNEAAVALIKDAKYASRIADTARVAGVYYQTHDGASNPDKATVDALENIFLVGGMSALGTTPERRQNAAKYVNDNFTA